MAIEIKIDDAIIQKVADEAVQRAVMEAVKTSGVIKAAVEKAVASVRIDTKQIDEALQRSLAEVMSNKTFFHELIKKAFTDNADKLRGNFESSVKRAGKDLAMPREVIEEVGERIKVELMRDYEKHGGGQFS